MKKKNLMESNEFLKDPATLQEAIERHARTSSAIEGIRVPRAEKSLFESNPYIRDSKDLKADIAAVVAASSAIEGIRPSKDKEKKPAKKTTNSKPKF